MSSSVSESGQALPFRRAVDTTASDVFEKTVYFYLYNNASDAANAPRYKTKAIFKRDVMRVRFNATGGRATWVDNSGQEWDHYNVYHETSASDAVPGVSTGSGLLDWSTGTAIVNLPSSGDAELFQNGVYRNSSTWAYNADVAKGLNTVKIYLVENGFAGRLMDITIENKLMNPGNPYNANVSCGNRNWCGNVQMFDVVVSDGVLNVQLSSNSAATNTDPFINGIVIRNRT